MGKLPRSTNWLGKRLSPTQTLDLSAAFGSSSVPTICAPVFYVLHLDNQDSLVILYYPGRVLVATAVSGD